MSPHRFIEAALSPSVNLGILDNNPENGLVDRLSERTGVPIERVRAMTLSGYGSMLMGGPAEQFTEYVCQFASLAPAAPRRESPVAGLTPDWRPWVCHDLLDDYPRSCRQCLATDQIPYTRIH